MVQLKSILLPVFLLFIFGCGNNSGGSELAMNNGEKWKINEEMIPSIKASEKLISDFVANKDKDYGALAQQLKNNNKELIASCNMTGPSHDELHKWLHPYMGMIEELEEAESEKDASHTFWRIQESFYNFNRFFQ